jgi:DNA-binding transcriptional ArsR family regulator
MEPKRSRGNHAVLAMNPLERVPDNAAIVAIISRDCHSVERDVEGSGRRLGSSPDPRPLISSKDLEESWVGELTEALGLSQPTVPHHLRVPLDAG